MRTSDKNMSLQSPIRFVSSSPPTPGEIAAGDGRWERRGLLGRLVRRQ